MASDDDGGASDGTITEYGQFREATAHKPLTPPAPQPQTWWLVPFILLTAAGGHASGHALMPAAPAMEKAGMSAIQYSLLTLVPIAGEVVMPVLWGRFYGRRPRSALCIAPLGLLSGQLAAAAALTLRERAGGDFDARSIALVISGLSLCLLSKGGLTVMQHAAMALAMWEPLLFDVMYLDGAFGGLMPGFVMLGSFVLCLLLTWLVTPDGCCFCWTIISTRSFVLLFQNSWSLEFLSLVRSRVAVCT